MIITFIVLAIVLLVLAVLASGLAIVLSSDAEGRAGEGATQAALVACFFTFLFIVDVMYTAVYWFRTYGRT